jgi:outer membrane protein insertion porin family
LYDKPISLQTRFSGFERRYESYDEGRLKGYVAFEKRYQSKWRRGFSFRLEEVKVSDIEFDAPKEIKDVRGRNNLAGVRVFVRKDTTGNRFMPYEGYHFNAGYEQVGGDYTFGILDGTHRWYKTLHEDLAERKTILEMKLHAGTIVGSDAPPFEKFYGGGTSSIRGFEYRGVSTRGLQTNVPAGTAQRKDPIGSDWIVTGSAEVAVPLAADVFSALFFVDAGMIDSGGPRVSVGTGLQILLPQWFGPVPMRFELATPVLKEKEDDKQIFSFSVGALF